jgi:hypothetical protein
LHFFFQKKTGIWICLVVFSHVKMKVWMYVCPFCVRLFRRLFFLVANLLMWSYNVMCDRQPFCGLL